MNSEPERGGGSMEDCAYVREYRTLEEKHGRGYMSGGICPDTVSMNYNYILTYPIPSPNPIPKYSHTSI